MLQVIANAAGCGAVMDQPPEYKFKIDAYTPDTIPMARLADYMKDLAVLLGEKDHVHFARLESGSVAVIPRIDFESIPKVRARLQAVNPIAGQGPDDALRAFQNLDRRLAEDNAVGHLCGHDGAVILRFPGRDKPHPLTFGAFRQPGSLDGVLIKLGGKDESVPVHLQDESTIHICNATREIARLLAPHLFASTLRVQGVGRWERNPGGAWLLNRFDIASFEILDDAPLGDVVASLRLVRGSDWKRLDDPYAELQRLRQGPGEVH